MAGWWAETFASIAAQGRAARAGLSGLQPASGVLVAAARRATAALTGAQPYGGTAAPVAQPVQAALSGVMTPEGALAVQLRAALFSGTVTPQGAVAAAAPAARAALAGAQAQQGTLAAASRSAAAAFAGGQQMAGTLAAQARAAQAALAGAYTSGVNPVVFDAVSAGFGPGTNPSFTLNAQAGSYAIVCAATFGVTELPDTIAYGAATMTKTVDIQNSSAGRAALYELANVPGGSQTISITTGNTTTVTAVAYRNVAAVYNRVSAMWWGLNNPPLSHPLVSEGAAGDMLLHMFGGYNMSGIESRTGGTERYYRKGTAGISVRESADSATFAGSGHGGNAGWVGMGAILIPEAITGRVILHSLGGGYTDTKATSGSCKVFAKAGDYVIADLVGDAATGTPAVTVDGAAMTLLSVIPYNNTSGQKAIRRYGAFVASTGLKTVAVSGATSGTLTLEATSHSNVVTVGPTTTAFGAASTAPTHAVTCSPGERIVQAFGSAQSKPLWVPSGGQTVFCYGNGSASSGLLESPLSVSHSGESTTFTAPATNTGNWASIATVLKP